MNTIQEIRANKYNILFIIFWTFGKRPKATKSDQLIDRILIIHGIMIIPYQEIQYGAVLRTSNNLS